MKEHKVIYLRGKVVAVSKNMAVINNYRRRAKVEAEVVEIADRRLFIQFTDGATLRTTFADHVVLNNWARRSQWVRAARVLRINGHEVTQ